MQCPKCQRENDPAYRFCIFCGTPLPTSEAQERSEVAENPLVDDTILGIADSSQKNVPKHQIEVETDCAGFQRRFLALIFDIVILGALFPVILIITYFITYYSSPGHFVDPQGTWGAGIFFWLCSGVIYFIGFWAWRGQTLGKMALKMKIVKCDGGSIGIGRAILRYIGYLLSTVIAFIGHFMVIWDRKKQGLHDKIAKTYVVKTHQAGEITHEKSS